MKIDSRLAEFSNEVLSNLIGQANKLDKGEGKVVRVYKDGWYYQIALTSQEISAFPLL